MNPSPIALLTVEELFGAYEGDVPEPYVLADAREPKAYLRGHLPGAMSLFWEEFVDDKTDGLLPPEGIAERLGARGIASNFPILLYDDGDGMLAGKMFWVLDHVGHPRLSILEGGITAWRHYGGELMKDTRTNPPTAYSALSPRENVATKDWILANMGRQDVLLVDTRSEAEYIGRRMGEKRRGHIPGAAYFEWTQTFMLNEHRVPKYLPESELRSRLAEHGILPEKEIVCYCRVGTRSAQVYSVLRRLDYPRVRNYLGSWAEWSRDPNTPVTTGKMRNNNRPATTGS